MGVDTTSIQTCCVVFGLLGSLLNPHSFTGTVTMFVLLQAFAAAGHKWTPELCKADSDGDGFTNGQELGDLDCTVRLSLLGLPTGGGAPIGQSLTSGRRCPAPGPKTALGTGRVCGGSMPYVTIGCRVVLHRV